MSHTDQDRIAYFEESWHSELSRSEQESVLQDPDQQRYLSTLWETSPYTKSWLAYDAIAGVTLVDVLGDGKMSLVCRGFSSGGNVICVKVPNYDEHSPESWDTLEQVIRNEAKVLQRLGNVNVKFGGLPKYVSDGQVEAHGRQCPYVLTNYIFGLVPLGHFVSDSTRVEMDFWRCASELLGEVHRRRVVHGDLHQGNVLVNSTGKPTLLDFGTSQVVSRMPLKLNLARRHFGPLMALHIDEVLSPHRPLSFAFDVFCLAELMRKRLGHYFEPIDEVSPRLLQDVAQGNGRPQQSARFHALIKKCTEPEPEYRLRNALEVSQALHNLEFGPAVDISRRLSSNLRVLLRKHFAFAATTLTAIAFFMLLSAFALNQFRHERRIASDQAIQAVKDKDALQKLQEANRAVLLSMQELIEGTADRDRVLEEVDSRVRNNVSKRLIELINPSILDFESQVTALGLALQIASSVMELDGWEAANSSTLAACDLAAQIQKMQGDRTVTAVLLYGIQGDAILSRIHYERGGLAGTGKKNAEQLAESAARQFLRLPKEHYRNPELRRSFMETGFQLAFHALYPQRDELWLKQDQGDLLWQVIHVSLQMADEHTQRFVRQEASLRRLFGLAMYKGAFNDSTRFRTEPNFGELSQNEYSRVLELLERTSNENGDISIREARQIQASVKSVLGMSLTNQGKYLEAQVALLEAFEIQQTRAAEFPDSLNRQREFISTGWNYADAIFAEAITASAQIDQKEVYEREIKIRQVVVDKCRHVLSRDRNRDSESAYLVNSVRLANSYYFSGQTPLALGILREIESTIGMEYMTFGKLRFDALPGLLIHANYAKDAERQIEYLRAYLEELSSYLNDPKTPKLTAREIIFIRTLLLEEFEFARALESWTEIMAVLDR